MVARQGSRDYFSGLLLSALMAASTLAATLPSNFTETSIPSPVANGTWNEAVGLTFSTTGRMFVWERGGRVWIGTARTRLPSPSSTSARKSSAGVTTACSGSPSTRLHNTGYVYVMYTWTGTTS